MPPVFPITRTERVAVAGCSSVAGCPEAEPCVGVLVLLLAAPPAPDEPPVLEDPALPVVALPVEVVPTDAASSAGAGS